MSFENFNKFLEEWWARKEENNAAMTKNNLEQACWTFRASRKSKGNFQRIEKAIHVKSQSVQVSIIGFI